MSLACFECRQIGSFDTLILYSEDGFNGDMHVSRYLNFYIHSHHISGCRKLIVENLNNYKNSFLLVQQPNSESLWNTGSDGYLLKQCILFEIDENIQDILPRCCDNLLKRKKDG